MLFCRAESARVSGRQGYTFPIHLYHLTSLTPPDVEKSCRSVAAYFPDVTVCSNRYIFQYPNVCTIQRLSVFRLVVSFQETHPLRQK